ncbi:MAG: BON domain-containing protein [Verrucomicrobiales bacterium]
MNKPTALFLSISLLGLGGYGCDSQPAAKTQVAAAKAAPDNTEKNVRDRSGATLTPGDQSESAADIALTQQIRQAVVADAALSTNAHNVKIITSNGVVTLRGPVASAQEKANIDAKAQQIAGATKVKNELEIAAN